jgi:hypothetical protein
MAERDTDTRHGAETMDPNRAYRMMTEYLKAGDYSEAHYTAHWLREWLLNGGFLPEVDGRLSDAPSALRRQVVAECDQIIDTAKRHIEV